MSWKLKTAEDGTPELKDGVPVYVDENGGEGPIDPNDMHRKILEVNAESKSRRERIEEMTARLKPLEGIDDVSAYLENAQKAVETVQNLEDSQLVQAGDVEKIKADAKRSMADVEKRLKDKMAAREEELQTELAVHKAQVRRLTISSKFAQHSLFSGPDQRTHIDPEMAESHFGKFFDVEDSNGEPRAIARDENGQVITSREPGKFTDPADFDEAMELIFAAYPKRDRYLKAGPGGSGSGGGKDGIGDPKTPLAVLQQQYAKAVESGNAQLMTKIKMRMSEARQTA